MKPPARPRILPNRYDPAEHERKRRHFNVGAWAHNEQRRLLTVLERLYRRSGGSSIDYAAVQKRLPQRSIPQLRSMVHQLQARAVSIGAHQLLEQRRAEESELGGGEEKPVQPWRDMAAFVAGDQEEPISTAFSQMLVVSSTEPQTLGNSACVHLPFGPAPPTKTVPVPQGHLPPGAATPSLTLKTPPSATPRWANSSPSTSAQGTSAPPSLALPGAGCRANSSAPQLLPQASGVAGATANPAGPRVEPVKDTGGESQQEQRSKFSVDFQKIYIYLANAQKEKVHSKLTPMECAVVLDLLMALPEELPLLECSALRQHMTEAYASLSAPASYSEPGTGNCKNPKAAATAAPRMAETPKTSETPVCPLNPFQVPLKLLVKRTANPALGTHHSP